MTILAEHSSGRFDVEPKALRAALAEQLANEPDFLSLTEMMDNARAAVLDDFAAYAVAHVPGPDGQDECALLVKRNRHRIVSKRAVQLSEKPIPRRGGKFDFALVVVVEDFESGDRHTRIVVHRPSGVEGKGGLDDNEQAEVYRDGTGGLRRLAASIEGRLVITGDHNLDLRKPWVRGYFSLHFPGFLRTWTSDAMPELGTLGDRVIDFSLLRGFSVPAAQVVPSHGASDHRAIRETHKEISVSTPMTPDQLLAQLKKFKVPYREIDGWRTRGRDAATGLKFGPVYGGVIHHTGSDAPDTNNRDLIIKGRSDLPGPLAQFGGNDDGVIDVISIHRCNHAGGGDPDVLEAVKAESYGDYPPHTDKHQGEAGAVDGNDCFYGEECYYSGSINMPAALYRSSVLLWAAVLDFHGWSAKSLIGHKEWSDWKPDPGRIDMKVMRADVQRVLDAQGADTTVEGPKFITPNITVAIAKNIAYDKALDDIKLAAAQDEVVTYRAQLKKQRVTLRDMERK